MASDTKAHQQPELGLSGSAVEDVVGILETTLADEFALYVKLRNYHWNVTGPQFHSLHETFEEQYTALETVIDETAERIRTYGAPSPGTLAEFSQKTRLQEKPGEVPDAATMVRNIVNDHEALVRFMREDVKKAGDELSDVALEDYLTGLLQKHQEWAWLLRANLESQGIQIS